MCDIWSRCPLVAIDRPPVSFFFRAMRERRRITVTQWATCRVRCHDSLVSRHECAPFTSELSPLRGASAARELHAPRRRSPRASCGAGLHVPSVNRTHGCDINHATVSATSLLLS